MVMKTKKTILFNVSGHGKLSKDRIGGVEKVVLQATESLKNEYKIKLFGDFPWAPKDIEVIPFSKRMGGSLKHLPSMSLYMLQGLPRMLKVDADAVIYTHQRNQLISIFYSKLKKKPLLGWELDHDPWVEPATAVKNLYRKLARNADLLASMSEEQKKRIVKSGIPAKKVNVIYQGIDANRYKPSAEKEKYILYVAKFLPRKNQLNLLKAFKLINDAHPEMRLVLVGPKSGGYTGNKLRTTDYYEECKSFIQQNLTGAVIHYEDISEEKLISLFQHALLYCMPSTEEGFGMSLLEAMAAGCACIVNNVAPLTEVIGDAGVLVNANRYTDLADAMKKIIENEGLRQSLQEKARNRAREVFSARAFGRKMTTTIEKLLSKCSERNE